MFKLSVLFTLACAALVNSQESCSNRCNVRYDAEFNCQCNTQCDQYGNCCSDYDEACAGAKMSCHNRCRQNYDSRNECHCDENCQEAGNCCEDFEETCTAAQQALNDLAQDLWDSDINAAKDGDIIIDLQVLITDTSKKEDPSPNPLFVYVADTLMQTSPTLNKLSTLLDNYFRYTGDAEDVTAEELYEVDSFMNSVLDTTVMRRAHDYLVKRGLVSPNYETEFRADLETIWFELYTRSGGPLDSSGFEHVFLGEVKEGSVSGFHGWLQFYLEELNGRLDYHGYTNEIKEIDTIGMQFEWDGYYKTLSSMFIGTSPEFELAIYTVCFKLCPNEVCKFDLNGFPVEIQTWKEHGKYIGSAYVMA